MFLKPYLKLTPTSGDGPRGPHRATSYIRAMVGRGRDTEIRVYRRHESGRKEGPHARPGEEGAVRWYRRRRYRRRARSARRLPTTTIGSKAIEYSAGGLQVDT